MKKDGYCFVTDPETDTLVPALEDVIELMPREEAILREDDLAA